MFGNPNINLSSEEARHASFDMRMLAHFKEQMVIAAISRDGASVNLDVLFDKIDRVITRIHGGEDR
jgi:hypothetical protein